MCHTQRGYLGLTARLSLLILALALLGVLQWVLSLHTADWTATTGEVLHSETRPHELNGERLYYLSLSYRYQAGGEERVGRRVTIAGGYGSRFEELLVRGEGPAWLRWWWRHFPVPATQSHDALGAMAGRFPPGVPVTVYYDPENPERSALIPSTDHSWFALAAGVFVLALVLIPLAWGLRALWRAVAGFAPGLAGVRRFFAVVGCLGLALALWGMREAGQARNPPPAERMEVLCEERGKRARWVSLEPDFVGEEIWQATGLKQPRFARCPGTAPVTLPLDFGRDELRALEGCRVSLLEPLLADERILDFGETRYYDEPDEGRYQSVFRVDGSGAGLWMLSRRSDSADGGTERRRWEGRLVPVTALADNRRQFSRENTALAPLLAGPDHALLSDRATPVETDRLRLFGPCAVAIIRDTFALSDPIWARARGNWDRLPDPIRGGRRPVLLDVHDPQRYARERTILWQMLEMLGWSLVAFGLVPIALSWFARLTGRKSSR